MLTPDAHFNEIFSGMTPLGTAYATAERSEHGCTAFKISVSDNQPYIENLLTDDAVAHLSAAEKRVADEVNRIISSHDIFGVSEEFGASTRVSLWDAPHIVNMITGITSITAPNGQPLIFSDMDAYPILKLEKGDQYTPHLILRTDEEDREDIVWLDDSHALCGAAVYKIRSIGQNYTRLQSLLSPIDKDIVDSYLSLFLTFIDNVNPEINGLPARFNATPEHSVPTLYLEKVAADKALYLRAGISIDSLGDTLPPGVQPTKVARLDSHGGITVRPVEGCDLEQHVDRLYSLFSSCAPDRNARKEIYRDGNFFIIPEATAGPFLLKHLPMVLETFRLVGSDKLREYKVVAAYPKLNLRLSSGIDFLEGDGEIEIGQERFSIGDLLNQYAQKKYVQLSDGNRGIIDESYIQRLQRLFRRRDKEGRIKVTLFDLPEVEEMIREKISGDFANHSRSVLEGFNSLSTASVPAYKVKATLRPYQNEGVKWLKYLYDNKLGGCLADDMGLGKTLQTIALLSLIYPEAKLPTLIVMPRSLLFNWEKELTRFAPRLKFHTYYGTERKLEEALGAQVILTTYGMVRNDIKELKEKKFQLIVLDESQNVKNVSAQTTLAVQLLQTEHRFALSGTPIENNLTELYSLFRFLNPPMFGTLDDFNASYTYPIQKYGDKDTTESLRRKIFPFILRRLKKDVLDDLPPRIDLTRFVEMSEPQRRLYNERRNLYRQQISETIARDGVQKSQFMMLQALGELRRIASIPDSIAGYKVGSPKVEQLIESLTEAVTNGHKSVIFFNFLAGLEQTMERLERLGIGFETMTGSTSAPQRKKVVERFQSDPDCMVMLMTLKVGGVGLNLTAADTVFIFEPWWNRAAEEQAINRLHRIGQKSTVSSFSLITMDTIEEKILQLQEQKSMLFNDLINADSSMSKQLTEKDIDFILS